MQLLLGCHARCECTVLHLCNLALTLIISTHQIPTTACTIPGGTFTARFTVRCGLKAKLCPRGKQPFDETVTFSYSALDLCAVRSLNTSIPLKEQLYPSLPNLLANVSSPLNRRSFEVPTLDDISLYNISAYQNTTTQPEESVDDPVVIVKGVYNVLLDEDEADKRKSKITNSRRISSIILILFGQYKVT